MKKLFKILKKIGTTIFYVLVFIGLVDMLTQFSTSGDIKIIQTILTWLFG